MWQKRCLIVAPVLAYVVFLSASLPSCGSSNSSSAPPAPTSTPITLIGVRICSLSTEASAATQCVQPASDRINSATSQQFFAQGQFSSNGVITYQDISTSATWFVNN